MPQFNPHRDQGLFLHYARRFWINGPRGSGRSTAMAMLAIEKVLKGEKVYLADPSRALDASDEYRNRRDFQRMVQDLLSTYYPDARVTFNMASMTMQLDARVERRVPPPADHIEFRNVPWQIQNIPVRVPIPARYNVAPAQARFLAEDEDRAVAQVAWQQAPAEHMLNEVVRRGIDEWGRIEEARQAEANRDPEPNP